MPMRALILLSLVFLIGCSGGVIVQNNIVDEGSKDCSLLFNYLENSQDINLGFAQRSVEESIQSAIRDCFFYNKVKGLEIGCNKIEGRLGEECSFVVEDINSNFDEVPEEYIRIYSDPSAECIPEFFNCLQTKAMLNHDFDECRNLEGSSAFSLPENISCMFAVGFYNGDASFCDEISDTSQEKITCLELFNIDGTYDNEILSLEEESEADASECGDDYDCMIRLAIDNYDSNYCEEIPDSSNEGQGKIALCYGLLAVATENLGYCRHEEQYYENTCRIVYDRYFSQFGQLTSKEFIDSMIS